MLAVLCCLAFLTRLLGSVGGKTTVTYPAIHPAYVKAGSVLELECEQSEGFKIQWQKADPGSGEYKTIDSNSGTGVLFLSQVIGKRVVRLIKENVTLDDEGSYRCAVLSGTDRPYVVQVYVVEVKDIPGLMTHPGDNATLSCIVSSEERISVEGYWSRKNKELDLKAKENKYSINVTHGENATRLMLTVKTVGEADIGLYECNIKLKNGNKFIHNVSLNSYPQVKPLGRSKNIVAGETLELGCKVWGWPLPNITWDFEGKLLNWSDSRISALPNGMLKIESVVASDRAVYVCTAFSYIDNRRYQTNTSILVRVKGKLAMLWPLLGIALEMTILSGIIYVYERNRARQRVEQIRKEATEYQSNSNAQPPRHQGRDNVRYRM